MIFEIVAYPVYSLILLTASFKHIRTQENSFLKR